jgi:hypothetical protein
LSGAPLERTSSALGHFALHDVQRSTIAMDFPETVVFRLTVRFPHEGSGQQFGARAALWALG